VNIRFLTGKNEERKVKNNQKISGTGPSRFNLMKIRFITSMGTVLLALLQTCFGQSFVNLDFEQATIAPTPVGGSTYPADPAQAFPGWTVGGTGTVVSYNDLSIGAPAVDLMGPNFPNGVNYTPLQGSYSALLQYFGYAGTPPTLSQTGLVPFGTESINFLVGTGESDAVVTLNGVNIPLVSIPGGRLAGNISAFADTVAQLTFSTTDSTGYAGNWLYFDDVQFSPVAVPEPGMFGLLVLGGLFFSWPLQFRLASQARHESVTQQESFALRIVVTA